MQTAAHLHARGVSNGHLERPQADHQQSFERRAAGTCLRFSAEHEGELRRAALIRQGLQVDELGGELAIAFQPIIDSHGGGTVALEALARWTHPDLGSVSPAEFIGVAETAGLMQRLTPLLFERTLCDFSQCPADIRLAFNLSMHDLMSADALSRLMEIVRESGLNPNRIDFEVTETVLMSDFGRGQRALERLRGSGFGVSLDDFGVGHSSLGYVHRLAFDKVKIDRSFISDLENDHVAAGVTKTMIYMCRNLGRTCVVEGVETQGQMLRLRQLGARYMQGYFFARPQSMAALLNASNSLSSAGFDIWPTDANGARSTQTRVS